MNTLTLEISDMQKDFRMNNVPETATVSELIRAAIPRMGLPVKDDSGAPVAYRAHLEREARHLNDSEVIGVALKDKDRVVFQPDIDAGNIIPETGL